MKTLLTSLLLIAALLRSPVWAATLTVTTPNDDGPGSLRSTLAGAAPGDLIQFAIPFPATIALTNGELVITNDLTIAGPGAANLAISGSNSNRVFNIASNTVVSLFDLTIRDGHATSTSPHGGGVLNAGTLTLSNCLVALNRAGDYAAGHGGGIFNVGTLTVVGCTFSSNQAGTGSAGASGGGGLGKLTADPGGPGGFGGGIYNASSLTIMSSTFYDNRGGTGGTGGAYYGGGNGASGGFGGSGGGVYNAGSLTSVSCTFKGNQAGKGGSGGMAISFPSPGYGGPGGTGGAGGGIGNGGTATVRNLIIALNAVGAGGTGGFGGASGPSGGPGSAPDLFGAFVSQGPNLIGANNGSTGLTNGINGNLVGTANNPVNPRLGAFQDNGGHTWTMSLLTGSPAIDAGDDSLTGTDQRGFSRLSGARVDIGAVEGVSASYSRGEALLVGDGANNSIVAIEVRSGAGVGTFVQPNGGASYQFAGPRGLLCVSNTLLVVNQNADTPYNGEVLAFDLHTGAFISKFVPSSNPNAPYAPRGMVRGSNGTLYVADVGGFDGVHPGRIARYNTLGQFLGNVVTTGLSVPFYPMGLVIGPDGLLYVSGVGNFAQGSINGYIFRFQFNPATQNYHYLSTIVTSTAANYYAPGLHSPEGIAFGPDGNLYVTSFYASFTDNQGASVYHTDTILVFDKNGQKLSFIDIQSTNQNRVFAQAILFGPRGDLFVPVTSLGHIRRYSAASNYQQFTTLPTEGPVALPQPWYLTFRATHPGTLAYQPPKLTGVVSGDSFEVSWPAGYVGWELQLQTNSLAGGFDWANIPESISTNRCSFTRTHPSAFCRLLAP